MPGLVINGTVVEVEGVEVINYLDDASLALTSRACSRRRRRVEFVIFHTTGGYPDHDHPTPQRVRDEAAGAEACHGRRVVADWAKPNARVGGAGVVVDADGTVLCCCDLGEVAAYHCVGLNQRSVGVEVVQQSDSSLYRRQLDVVAVLTDVLARRLELPRTVASPYRGCRVEFDVDAKGNKSYRSGLEGVSVVGHRECSENRGSGDPGDFVMAAVLRDGWTAIG